LNREDRESREENSICRLWGYRFLQDHALDSMFYARDLPVKEAEGTSTQLEI
jgi:hypothetical protein